MTNDARRVLTDACTEAELQRFVEDVFATFGWLIFHDNDARKNRAGFPDLVCVHPVSGHVLFVELKRQSGRLRPAQVVWGDALGRAYVQNGRATHRYFVWRPSDMRLIEEVARGK